MSSQLDIPVGTLVRVRDSIMELDEAYGRSYDTLTPGVKWVLISGMEGVVQPRGPGYAAVEQVCGPMTLVLFDQREAYVDDRHLEVLGQPCFCAACEQVFVGMNEYLCGTCHG